MSLEQTKSTFEKIGFVFLKNVVPESIYYEYAIQKAKMIPWTSDPQVPNTPSYPNDPLMTLLHTKLLPLIEKTVGKELYKTYNYYRIYKKGDVLKRHKDREACEISATICLGFKPDISWPIYINDRDGNPTKVEMQPGDVLVYDGVSLEHWREEFFGLNQVQLFVHYVDKNGPYANLKDDPQGNYGMSR